MHNAKLTLRTVLVVGTLLMTTHLSAMTHYAQGPTPSASGATPQASGPAPSDLEIRKTLSRALDKVEAQAEALAAKDAVISEMDGALAESERGRAAYRSAAESFKAALDRQTEATRIAKEGWQAEEKRRREMEKKVRSANDRAKWIAVGAAAAIITTIFISR